MNRTIARWLLSSAVWVNRIPGPLGGSLLRALRVMLLKAFFANANRLEGIFRKTDPMMMSSSNKVIVSGLFIECDMTELLEKCAVWITEDAGFHACTPEEINNLTEAEANIRYQIWKMV
jgi:hypothetical protein